VCVSACIMHGYGCVLGNDECRVEPFTGRSANHLMCFSSSVKRMDATVRTSRVCVCVCVCVIEWRRSSKATHHRTGSSCHARWPRRTSHSQLWIRQRRPINHWAANNADTLAFIPVKGVMIFVCIRSAAMLSLRSVY